MELRQLKYFVTVADTLNFSEASRQLFITQGTLSQQIRQLEDEFGAQLFERTSHSVRLTEAGEELLPLARRTLEDSRQCRNRMKDLQGSLAGTLNIGVTHSFTGVFTDTVKVFLKKYPGVQLKISYETASELIDMLRCKELDLIIAFKPVKEYEDLESEVLFDSVLSVVMRKGHPLSGRDSIQMEDLEPFGIVLPGKGLQARRTFEQFVGIDTRKFDVRAELNDPTLIMDIIQGTDLVSMVSSLAVYYRQNLVAIPIDGGSHAMPGCIHRLKDGYRKRSAEVFAEMLRDSAMIERICRSV